MLSWGYGDARRSLTHEDGIHFTILYTQAGKCISTCSANECQFMPGLKIEWNMKKSWDAMRKSSRGLWRYFR